MMRIDGNAKKCSGCGACQSICPADAVSMNPDKQGFIRPVVDTNVCIDCGMCKNVCPIDNNFMIESNKLTAIALKKKKRRMESQSGGAFAVLAEESLSNGGIVYGVEIQGCTAQYVRIHSVQTLKKVKGSKYVQAETRKIFQDVEMDLLQGKEVLFSGTACHVDGLLHFLKKKNVNEERLYTVDLVCDGVVSPGIFQEYITAQEERYGQISRFNFRDKHIMPWGEHVISFLQKGRRKIVSRKYVDIFYSRLCLRPCCYKCAYATLNRVADITLGDYWGIEGQHRGFIDSKGVSLVLLDTEKGKILFERAKHRAVYLETPIKECMEAQPNLRGGRGKPAEYEDFWQKFYSKDFLGAVGTYCNYDGTKDYAWTVRMTIKKLIRDYLSVFPLRNLYRMLRRRKEHLNG